MAGDSIAGNGVTHNISENGCRIRADVQVNVGQYLMLSLGLSKHRSPVKVEMAAVRWAMGYDFGVEFVMLAASERQRLNLFIESAQRQREGQGLPVEPK